MDRERDGGGWLGDRGARGGSEDVSGDVDQACGRRRDMGVACIALLYRYRYRYKSYGINNDMIFVIMFDIGLLLLK